MHQALPEELIATVSQGGRFEELVGFLSSCVSEVVMNRLDRCGLCICDSPPHILSLIHSLIGMILNGVDLGVLNVWPVRADGLVISLVCGVAMLEGAVLRRLLLVR